MTYQQIWNLFSLRLHIPLPDLYCKHVCYVLPVINASKLTIYWSTVTQNHWFPPFCNSSNLGTPIWAPPEPRSNPSSLGLFDNNECIHFLIWYVRPSIKKKFVCCTPTYPLLSPLPKTFFWHFWKIKLCFPPFSSENHDFPIMEQWKKNVFPTYLPNQKIQGMHQCFHMFVQMIIEGQFSSVLHKNICCGYSLARRGDSNEYPQHMFSWRNNENNP